MTLRQLRRARRLGQGWVESLSSGPSTQERVNTQETPQEAAERRGEVYLAVNEHVARTLLHNLVDGSSMRVQTSDVSFYLSERVYRCSIGGCPWTSVRQGQFKGHAEQANRLRKAHRSASPVQTGGERPVSQCSACGNQHVSSMRVQMHIDGARALLDHRGASELVGPIYALEPPSVVGPKVSLNGHHQPVSAPAIGSGAPSVHRRSRRRHRRSRHASAR